MIFSDYDPIYAYQWKRDGVNTGNHSSQIYAQIGGDYTLVVEVTEATKCTKAESDTITVTTMEPPDKPSVSLDGSANICMGESVKLSVPSVTGYSYQWRIDENNLSGAVKNTYSAATSGYYSVRITNPNGCSAVSNPVPVTVSDPPG